MSMPWTPKWAKNYVIKSNRSAMSIHPLAAGCSSEWLQGWLPMPATFQNLPELTVQVLHFAIICSYALAVHNTLPYCQDQRDKSPLPEHQLQSPKSTPLRICSEKKTRPTSPLCPQTRNSAKEVRNSAKESKDADAGHSENVLCAKMESGSGPMCLQYKVRTKDGLANILVLCRILEANTFSKQLR